MDISVPGRVNPVRVSGLDYRPQIEGSDTASGKARQILKSVGGDIVKARQKAQEQLRNSNAAVCGAYIPDDVHTNTKGNRRAITQYRVLKRVCTLLGVRVVD